MVIFKSSLGSDFGSEGWGFESLQARQLSAIVAVMSPVF
jgi:hypothetical protein